MNSQIAQVRVQLDDRGYDIEIGHSILAELPQRLASRVACPTVVLISDQHVAKHAQEVASVFSAAGSRVVRADVEPGEKSKSVEIAHHLWQDLLTQGTDRKSVVIAVGGGVVGDLAGFVAATFARGIPFCQVPTTLLAQVDSSVGGKVGVNLPQAKNMVGAFWQPVYVLIDTDVLRTLPDREYRSGLAEVVKYGMILDDAFFEYLEDHVEQINRRDAATLRLVISRCCRLKADVVQADEREETGLRAVLNYGHTYAHAIEATSGYGSWLHGEAVAMGMTCAARLATMLKRIEPEVEARQRALLKALGLPVTMPEGDPQALLRAMQRDKKTEQGRLRLVLPECLGHVELVSDVTEQQVIQSMESCRET